MADERLNAYRKERKRVQSLIYKLNKQGHNISPSDIIGEFDATNGIGILKRFKTQNSILDYIKEGKIDLPSEVDIIIDNFEKQFDNTEEGLREAIKEYLNEYMDKLKEIYGDSYRDVFAQAVKNLANEGVEWEDWFRYEPEYMDNYIWELDSQLRYFSGEEEPSEAYYNILTHFG